MNAGAPGLASETGDATEPNPTSSPTYRIAGCPILAPFFWREGGKPQTFRRASASAPPQVAGGLYNRPKLPIKAAE
jgi:hypothetical protein